MTVTAKQMVAPQLLTGSAAVYYTVPANTTSVIKRATFTNTSNGAVTITVYIVAAAGSIGNGNTIISALPIAASGNVPYVSPELAGQTMPPGTTIQMLAGSASDITAYISGVEIV